MQENTLFYNRRNYSPHMIQNGGVSLSINYSITCQILPTLLPLIDSGGNWFGIVVLRLDSFVIFEFRLLDSFVILEFSIVSLDVTFIVMLPVWLELEFVDLLEVSVKSVVTEEIGSHVLLEGNSPNML